MKSTVSFWLYVLAAIANLIGHLMAFPMLILFTKPLGMPLLLYFVYMQSKGRVTLRILFLCLAIMLSWIGDITLMYEGSLYFLSGIGFFLIALLVYAYVLYLSTFQRPYLQWRRLAPFVAYAIVWLVWLLPHAGAFTIPVLLYGMVVLGMGAVARLREGHTPQLSYQWALYGSILFIISDSLLAINKFYGAIPYAGVWVMGTYYTAQYLLTIGILKHED